MQRANINGTELAYELQGNGEPVVLIHGGVLADVFVPMMKEPALANYRLINYHRRGYGQSAPVQGFVSVQQQADDCLSLMKHLGIDRAHIAGYSLGGSVAIQLAIMAPDVVHSLSLLEPLVPNAPLDEAAQQYFLGAVGRSYEIYGRGDKLGAMHEFSLSAFGPDYRKSLEKALPGAADESATAADAMFGAELPSMQQWGLVREDVASIKQPVLYVYHKDPNWSGFQVTYDLLSPWLPQTETFVCPGTSHLLQATHPRPVAEAMAAFMARNPLTASA
jgi:pimeloyl-ACP methyl ester carboxylesterase